MQAYAYSGDQSWTEISNANFIRIVECPADHMAYGLSVVVADFFCFFRNVCCQSNSNLLTFRQQLAAEFASRNCAYTAAVPATA